MDAQVLTHPAAHGPPPVEAATRPAPEPGQGEILISVLACACCRTDLQLVRGDLPARRLPVIPGHQVVGRVLAVGPGVDAWREGEVAGAFWLAEACGHCPACESGRENLCADARFTGWDVDGGYAEQIVLRADFACAYPRGIPRRWLRCCAAG